MKLQSIMRSFAIAALFCGVRPVLAEDVQQKTFASPEDAVVALVDAAKADNTNELRSLFGPEGEKVLVSGDPVMDQRSREVFLVAYSERAALMTISATQKTLYIGNEDWPFPIPLVKENQTWRFDTAAGAKEILFRRIGRNELTTIRVCQAYVDAQQEYAAKAHDGKPRVCMPRGSGAHRESVTASTGNQTIPTSSARLAISPRKLPPKVIGERLGGRSPTMDISSES